MHLKLGTSKKKKLEIKKFQDVQFCDLDIRKFKITRLTF